VVEFTRLPLVPLMVNV
jgi:hypothetical protein